MAEKHPWCHSVDCSIHTRLPKSEIKDVIDSNGESLFCVPSSWTDEQIWLCLKIANNAHDIGHRRGEIDKVLQMQKVLEI